MVSIFGVTQETVVNNTSVPYAPFSQENPDVAIDNSGDFIVVWDGINDISGSFPTYAIYGQRFDAIPTAPFTGSATKLGGEFQINSFDTDNQSRVSVAVGGTGSFIAVWDSFFQDVPAPLDSGYGVYARRYESITSGISTSGTDDVRINTTTTSNQGNPSIAMDGSGNYVVAWRGRGTATTDNNDIYIQRFSASGAVLQGETRVNTTAVGVLETPPVVAMNSSGAFVVVWTSQISGNDDVFFALYNSSGNVIQGPTQVNQTTISAQNNPSVAINDAGEFVIVWQSAQGGTTDVYARKYTSAGLPVAGAPGNETLVHASTLGSQEVPDVDIDSNGNFVVVWQDNNAEGTGTPGIFARRFITSGADGDAIRVNQSTTRDQFQPAIAMRDNGDFVVTWVSDQVTTDDNNIYVRQFIINDAPTDLTLSSTSVNENVPVNTVVATINGIDSDVPYDTLTYTLVGGSGSADNASFNINGNQLRLNVSPDFETKDTYNIRLQVTDQGGLSYQEAFVITINPSNQPPTDITFSNTVTSLAENTSTASPIRVADLTVVDDALGSETLTLSGADASFFTIVGNQLFLQAGVPLNFEAKSSYSVTVNVNDPTVGGNPDASRLFNLTLTDVNEPPTAVNFANTLSTLTENIGIVDNFRVADIAIADDALGIETLSLSGADADSFIIVGNQLFLRAGVILDFETKSTYNVTVNADDTTVGVTPDAFQTFTLTVTDINEAPTAASLVNTITTLPEDTSTNGNIKVADITITDDALGTENLTLTGADAAVFTIIGNSLFLRAGVILDFETQPTYNVIVNVDDPTAGPPIDFALPFTLTVTDANDAPAAVNFGNAVTTLAENTNTTSRIKVADVTITDADGGTNNLSLSGTDANFFELDGSTLFLKAGVVLDFEAKASYNITVNADDPTVGGTPDASNTFTLSVTDINEAPTAVNLINTTATLPENTNTLTRIQVADITVTDDALGTETLSLSGDDAAFFEIDGGVLYLRAGVALDFENKPTYNVTVNVDDATVGSNPDAFTNFTFTVTDANEVLTAASLVNTVTTLTESTDTSNAIRVADISITDDALGTENLTLSGADASSFIIIGNSLFLRAGVALDFENKVAYSVDVSVDDPTVGTSPDIILPFTLAVTNANEAPLAVDFFSPTTILDENTNTFIRIKVADITITDPDGGTNTLSLSGADAAFFEISGNELYLKAGTTLNFEAKSTYNVTVNADDTTVGTTPDASNTFTLTLIDINEAPTANFINTTTALLEGTDTSTRIKVADISVIDDALGTETLSLSGADATFFEIDGNGLYLKANTVLNFANKPAYNITVNVDDPTVGATPDVALPFTLNVTALNQAPTAVNFTNTVTAIAENTSTATRIRVADIGITDDGQGTNNLFLTGSDANFFEIDNGVLYLKANTTLNFESKSSFNITVNVDDPTVGGTPDAFRTFNLSITNANDAPVLTPAAPFLPAVVPNQVNSGYTVASFVGNSISDEDAGAVEGIAIIARSSNNGTWQYSTNNGSRWFSVGTVSGSNALLLRSTDLIRFVPSSSSATITNTSLTYRAWDRTSGVAGTKVNITTTGGSSAFSRASDTVALGITRFGGNGNNTLNGSNGPDYLNGGNGNDSLFGSGGNDTLVGSNGDDLMVGGAGGDRHTGSSGKDTYRYTTLSDSLLSNFDRITDLQIDTDRIDGPTSVSAANVAKLGSVSSLTQSGISAVLTSNTFRANRAATFTFGTRRFVALNDGTASFQASSDAIIEITGFSGNIQNLAIV